MVQGGLIRCGNALQRADLRGHGNALQGPDLRGRMHFRGPN